MPPRIIEAFRLLGDRFAAWLRWLAERAEQQLAARVGQSPRAEAEPISGKFGERQPVDSVTIPVPGGT